MKMRAKYWQNSYGGGGSGGGGGDEKHGQENKKYFHIPGHIFQ